MGRPHARQGFFTSTDKVIRNYGMNFYLLIEYQNNRETPVGEEEPNRDLEIYENISIARN